MKYNLSVDVQSAHQALWARAIKIFGSEAKADCWFHTRLSELTDSTPEEVLERTSSTEPIDTVLDRIEYGVFV